MDWTQVPLHDVDKSIRGACTAACLGSLSNLTGVCKVIYREEIVKNERVVVSMIPDIKILSFNIVYVTNPSRVDISTRLVLSPRLIQFPMCMSRLAHLKPQHIAVMRSCCPQLRYNANEQKYLKPSHAPLFPSPQNVPPPTSPISSPLPPQGKKQT